MAALQNAEVKCISTCPISKERHKLMIIVLHLLFAFILILSTCIIGGQCIKQTPHKADSYVTWSLLG